MEINEDKYVFKRFKDGHMASKNIKVLKLPEEQLKLLKAYLKRLNEEIDTLGEVKDQTPAETKELARKQREKLKVEEAIELQERYMQWGI